MTKAWRLKLGSLEMITRWHCFSYEKQCHLHTSEKLLKEDRHGWSRLSDFKASFARASDSSFQDQRCMPDYLALLSISISIISTFQQFILICWASSLGVKIAFSVLFKIVSNNKKDLLNEVLYICAGQRAAKLPKIEIRRQIWHFGFKADFF